MVCILVKNLFKEDLFDVICLEARDRVGGRVYTDHKRNEIGAAWVHGTELVNGDGTNEINPVYEFAREIIPDDDFVKTMEFLVAHSDGSELYAGESLWDFLWEVLDKIKDSDLARAHAFKPTSISVNDYINDNWNALFSHLPKNAVSAVIKIVMEWQSYYATKWETTSIGSLAVDKEFKGDQLLIKNGGYSRILNHYLDHYNLRDKIKLNHPVNRIDRTDHGCTVYVQGESPIEADIVVVTVPLGVLKANQIEFNPPLPEEKQGSINRLGFGVYDKIFITFDKPIELDDNGNGFFDPKADVISIVPKANDDVNKYYLSAKLQTMNPAEIELASSHPHRKYDERDEGHIGIEMVNVSKVAEVPKVVMLIYGKAALDMEAIADDKSALTQFAMSKLANAFPNCVIPNIVEIDATAWGKDPFSYGSFAHIPINSSGQDMEILSKPIDETIFFAGEATFYKHYSTVHGALISGRREYARIMEKFYPGLNQKYLNLLDN